jgi:SAM-dependent methyltransferase
MPPLYDDIGRTYTTTRREDPRLAAMLRDALGDARTVVNVGAGTGAYEPAGLDVTPVEPSEVMIAQRRGGRAGVRPVVRAVAEALPFEDSSFDVALAVLSDHHWADRAKGLAEMARVARRVVLFNCDPAAHQEFWFNVEYMPAFFERIPPRYRTPGVWEAELSELLDAPVRLEPWPIPHDCTDGFYGAFWRRPEAYLDPEVRAGISVFSAVGPDAAGAAIAKLERDLADGTWARRHADLMELDALDLGYRVVVAEPARRSAS